MSGPSHDPETLAFYDREAATYAGRRLAKVSSGLADFMAQLPTRGHVLDLGCGGGQDSEVLLANGFRVTPLDGSRALAQIAETRLGQPVRVQLFEDLDDQLAFDGILANASLLHVPLDRLGSVLARVFCALKPGGVFHASYKAGEGGARDTLGRYFNFPSQDDLTEIYAQSAPWLALDIRQREGHSYEQALRTWLLVRAVKPA